MFQKFSAYLMHSFSFDVQENTTSFPHPFLLYNGEDLGWHLLPQAWPCFPATTSHAEGHHLAIGVHCDYLKCFHVLRLRLIESSSCIQVCHAHRRSYYSTTFFITEFLSSCQPQCFCSKYVTIICKCWQLIPSIPPTCRFFHFSGSKRRRRQDAYHWDITDVNAIAL